MRAFFKDPLTHFLIAGLLLFLIGNSLQPPEADEKRIVVDRAALLEFIQFRSKAFEPNAAASLLDSITGEARDRLIRDFVEEEALYREAQSLGLDANDYVIKQRLVQKLDFISGAAGELEPSEADITAWFETHRDDYAVPPSVTFAHVFFTNERRGAEEAKALAAETARRLAADAATFEDAVGKGERFPFHTNYVERTYDYVESQFGEAAASQIFSDSEPLNAWRGPIVSPYGAHAIFVRDITPARRLELSEAKERVAEDVARARAAELKATIIAELVAQYDVIVEPDSSAKAAGGK